MTKILIDLSTLKRNPRAGETQSSEPGLKDFNRIVQWRRDGILVTEHQASGDGNTWTVYETKRESSDKPDMPETIIRQTASQEVVKYSHRPIREWDYSFTPTLVTCKHCGTTFLATEMDTDDIVTEDDEITVDKCPKCGELEPVALEYETVAEALRRKGGQ